MSSISTASLVSTAALEVVAGIQLPHDPATIFVYVLLAATALVVWYGHRQSRESPEEGGLDGSADESSAPSSGGEPSDERPN